MAISTAEFRKNLKIEVEGIPFVIVECQHVKPGKGSAFVSTRMRNLINGKVLERNFKSGETVDTPNIESKSMQFMYKDEEGFHFMDNATFEQTFINGEVLGDQAGFMQENVTAEVMFFNGKAIGAELPIFGTFTVVKTDPGFKGDTVQGGTKPATLDTGAIIQVPLFVLEGDIVKVDTRDGNYIERAGRK